MWFSKAMSVYQRGMKSSFHLVCPYGFHIRFVFAYVDTCEKKLELLVASVPAPFWYTFEKVGYTNHYFPNIMIAIWRQGPEVQTDRIILLVPYSINIPWGIPPKWQSTKNNGKTTYQSSGIRGAIFSEPNQQTCDSPVTRSAPWR